MAKEYTTNFFEDQVKEEFLDKRKKSIHTNQQHNEHVCLLANSFYGSHNKIIQLTGFKTILLEPLFNISTYLEGNQSKNFDIMLHNSVSKHTIFVEVKTGFLSIEKLLKDFKEAMEITKNRFDKDISEKIGLKLDEHSYVEFVLLVPREQSLNLKERIAKEEIEGIIVWELSTITSPNIEIKHEISRLDEMIEKRQTHLNENLRKQLYDGLPLKPPIKIFNFLLNSDPYQKLTYFTPLIRALELDKFNFLEIKSRILDEEKSFSAYLDPEKSKEFIYKEIIKHLKAMNVLTTVKQSENEFENEYDLKMDKRVNEVIIKNKVSKLFLETYLKNNEVKIKQEALNRYNKHHGQATL